MTYWKLDQLMTLTMGLPLVDLLFTGKAVFTLSKLKI